MKGTLPILSPLLWVGIGSVIEAGTFEAAYPRTPTPAEIAAMARPVVDPQGAAGILPKSSGERKWREAFPQNKVIPLDVAHRLGPGNAHKIAHAVAKRFT